jgi:hypothetical protein
LLFAGDPDAGGMVLLPANWCIRRREHTMIAAGDDSPEPEEVMMVEVTWMQP